MITLPTESLAVLETTHPLPWLIKLFAPGRQSFQEALADPQGFFGPRQGTIIDLPPSAETILEVGWRLLLEHDADYLAFIDDQGLKIRYNGMRFQTA